MTDCMIAGDVIVVAAEHLASADLDGEAILLDINTGRYYGLNAVGASIMDLIKEPRSMTAILEELLRKYNVAAEQLEQDLTLFLQEMEERQLIRVMNGAAS